MRFSILFSLLTFALAPIQSAPNVLFIMADDLRDFGGAYTRKIAKTPHLDRLAQRAVRFENAYAQYPVCNPSRTSLLTGQRPEQTGIVGNGTFFRSALPDVITLPQSLRQKGYTAHAFGKIFHSGNTGEMQRREWLDEGKSWDVAKELPTKPEGQKGDKRNLSGGKIPWCVVGQMDGIDEDQSDGQSASAAVASITSLTAEKRPWFVAAGFHRPHDPFLSPRKYFDLYPLESLPTYQDPEGATPLQPHSVPKGWPEFKSFTQADQRDFLRAYLAGVSFMDAQVGRLLDTLDRLNLWDSTVVVFVGDHGYHLGERQWWNKDTLFERSCSTPLYIAAPGVKGGRVCSQVVELVDLYPTLSELCEQAAPLPQAGKSLVPVLRDAQAKHKEAAYTLVTRGPKNFGRTVRTQRWRFTQWSDGATELYDHEADPEETTNLAAAEAHASVVVEMKSHLGTLPPWPKGASR